MCSSPDDKNEKKYCSNLHQCGNQYRACPQVPTGTKKHTECYLTPTVGQFNCLNRMDKYPDIIDQRIYQQEDFNLNKHLNYTESGIYCNETLLVFRIDIALTLRPFSPLTTSVNTMTDEY